jgi:hypothetical protein
VTIEKWLDYAFEELKAVNRRNKSNQIMLTRLTRMALARSCCSNADREGRDNGAGASFFRYAIILTHTSWGRGLTGIFLELEEIDGRCEEFMHGGY